jgi:toxin secretion/phage lysis holin
LNYGEVVDFVKNILKVNPEMMYYGSLLGAGVTVAVGGFDKALNMLATLIALDYLTGLTAAVKTKTQSSKVGFKGLIKKLVIFAFVAFANTLDGAMQLNHLLRSMVIFGYAANEGLSILENIERMGYGNHIPEFLRTKINQLKKDKGVDG